MKFYDKTGGEHKDQLSAFFAGIGNKKNEDTGDYSFDDDEKLFPTEDKAESNENGSDGTGWVITINFKGNHVTITDGGKSISEDVKFEHDSSKLSGKTNDEIKRIITSAVDKALQSGISEYICACGQSKISASEYDANNKKICPICNMAIDQPVQGNEE